jgi:hypothetical protein
MCGGITIRWSGPGILRDLLSPLHDKDARFAFDGSSPGRSAQSRYVAILILNGRK